jgi:hypothetical protein
MAAMASARRPSNIQIIFCSKKSFELFPASYLSDFAKSDEKIVKIFSPNFVKMIHIEGNFMQKNRKRTFSKHEKIILTLIQGMELVYWRKKKIFRFLQYTNTIP